MSNGIVNINFIQKNNLVKSTLLGLFCWVLIFFLVPLRVRQQIGFIPFIYLMLNYVFFILGIKIISTIKKEKRQVYKIKKQVLTKVLWIVLIIAFFGFFLKTLDKFYIRGVSLSYPMSYNRILLEKSGASILSIISAITTPFSFLTIICLFYKKHK